MSGRLAKVTGDAPRLKVPISTSSSLISSESKLVRELGRELAIETEEEDDGSLW